VRQEERYDDIPVGSRGSNARMYSPEPACVGQLRCIALRIMNTMQPSGPGITFVAIWSP